MSSSCRILLVLSSALLALPSTAHAQEEENSGPSAEVLTQAQALLSEANALYAAERYDEAREAYQAAYDLTEAPGFLYNIAQSHRLAGQCRPAIEFYEKFLSLDPKTTLRSKVEGFVAQMWTCLDEEKKQAEAANKQSTDPEPEFADETASKPERVASAPTGSTRPSEGPSRMPVVGLAVAGTGVLALATSVYFGLSARSTSTEIESYSGPWGAAQEADEAEAQRFERFAIVLGVAGGAALAGGLATYFLTRTGDKSSSVAVLPSEGGLFFAYSSAL